MSHPKETSTPHEYSIRVIEFKGTNFPQWNSKQLARANRRHTKGILLGTIKIPTKGEYELALAVAEADRNPGQLKTIENYELNTLAYDDLVLSMNSETKKGMAAWTLVDNAVTTANPDGDAAMAYKKLRNRYMPKDLAALISLEEIFVECKLESVDEDPDVWITKLETTMTLINKCEVTGTSKKTPTDLICHILASCPEEYDGAIAQLHDTLETLPSTEDKLERVRVKLIERYKRIRKNRKAGGKGGEVALSTYQESCYAAFRTHFESEAEMAAYMSNFKGNCNKCGKYGHKSVDCPSNNPQNNGNGNGNREAGTPKVPFKGKCHHCGKYGHKKFECNTRKAEEKGACAKDEDEDVEMQDNESIDEIGFVARDSGSRVQHDVVRTAEAPQASANKRYKRSVTSDSVPKR